MGFQLPRKTLRIDFDGTDYDGAEVVLSMNTSIDTYLNVSEARKNMTDRQWVEFIADRVVEWNLEDPETGEPIPADVGGMLSLDDFGFLMTLFVQWEKAIKGVTDPGPLSQRPSSNGATSGILT